MHKQRRGYIRLVKHGQDLPGQSVASEAAGLAPSSEHEKNRKDQSDLLTELTKMVESGAVKHLLVAVLSKDDVSVLSTEMEMYDCQALVGILQTDVMRRQLGAEICNSPSR